MWIKHFITLCFSESNRGRGNAVVVGLPQNGNTPVRNAYTAPGGHVTLITLNNECKFNSPQLDGACVIDLYNHSQHTDLVIGVHSCLPIL